MVEAVNCNEVSQHNEDVLPEMQAVRDDAALVNQNLPDETNAQELDSDDKLLHSSDTNSLSAHNEQYTEILKAYVTNYKRSSAYKRKASRYLFNISMGLLIALPALVVVSVIIAMLCVVFGGAKVLDLLPALITALGTFAGTYMLIHEIIAKYMFSEKEEEHLTDIIDKIQEYDKEIRDGL